MSGRPNHIRLGPIIVRIGGRGLAPWGYPRLKIGGLSVWSWSNTGDFMPAGYHPRESLTWLWSVRITRRGRGYHDTFSKAELGRMARLYVTGNPYAFRIRWWHRFVQLARVRQSHWHHYLRLPCGWTLVIGRQKAVPRKASQDAQP